MESEEIELEEEESHVKLDYEIEECSMLFKYTDLNPPPPPPPPPKIDENEGIMLEPDHPLLAKFQSALKNQLERQIAKLAEEVGNLESGIKKKNGEREQMGVSVYDAQQMVQLQYESIEQFETDLKKTNSERHFLESELRGLTEVHILTKNKLNVVEKKELELRDEITSMNFMYMQMQKWEEKLQSELTVQQRISEKSKIDRKQFSVEKRQLDFLIYKLMTEVFRLENGLDHFSMQLRVKEHERENLATAIASANVDIEQLEFEHKRLMHSWNCVLIAIGHRDKLYNVSKKELQEEQERLKQVLTETTMLKKLSNEEMTKNEELTLIKERIRSDRQYLNYRLNNENDKVAKVEKKIMETETILKQTRADLNDTEVEKKLKEQAIAEARREIEKKLQIKFEIEEKILALLQEQMSNDKISKYMNKKIHDIRENNRNLEIHLAEIENKNADFIVRIERQKHLNVELENYLSEIAKKEKELEKERASKSLDIKHIETEIRKMYVKFDEASRKLDELITHSGGVELSPVEQKIKELEMNIAEFDEKNVKMKAFWLRQQSYIVVLKNDRHTQLAELKLIRKQSMLLQQKNLKLEDELLELEAQEKHFVRNMTNITYKIDKMNQEMFKKRGQKQYLDSTTTSFKNEYMERLKDAELDCIRLEDKVIELEEEKADLSKEIIEVNRDCLSWEKKTKLAEETKRTLKQEKSSEGELGTMKSEIHRMNVRYAQLRRAQEKLVHDLNSCISRREFIFINAEATEKRLSLGGSKITNRINLKRKLEDARAKVKKTENEIKSLQKKIKNAMDVEEELHDKIQQHGETIEDMKQKMWQYKNNIEQAKFDRQKELEVLVFKQHKLRSFTAISKGQYRPQFRSESALDNEFCQQEETNSKLQSVTENLIIDFPQYFPNFKKILNTLRVVYEN